MPRKKKNPEPRYCKNPECGELLDPEWASSNRLYCSRECRNRRYYVNKGSELHRRQYAKDKRQWEKSSTGKKANFALRRWLKLPRTFR